MASSSSSLLFQIKYEVFLSFRGTDVRHGFLSHLTKELLMKQIDAYVDERLESGEEISSALVTAIEGSLISLVIFSQHYASSRWCLEELVRIIDCNKVNHQIVIPVFYNVDPTDVRHQTNTYGDAFAKHEKKYDKGKLQSWRSALNKAANLSGHHYPSNFKNESELITVIVQDVLEKLKLQVDSSLDESTRLVGFQKHFSCVESLLEFESQDVKIIGIWGMGGIGKTTLSQHVFDKFSSQFQSSCFIENVKEDSEKTGLSHLLQNLYCKLLNEANLNIYDTNTKISIKRRLARKKVLIVLDDVSTVYQLEKLVGKEIYLGRGSRVIITTRDRHVLDCKKIHVYEIGELSDEESLELFSLFAFDKRKPEIGYEELSKSVILYAKGIPLALRILGSHLLSRTKEEWEDALKELQRSPNKEIQDVLRVSYNGLSKLQQNIFLDIAFFFKGDLKGDVTAILDACGFCPIIGIKVLQEKALITISNDNRLKMHDLLQEMGEQIVREESDKHPARRSRLKDLDDLYDVLQKNNGTDEIEGIVFDVSRIKNVYLSRDTFTKMANLRILKIYSRPWCEKSNVIVPFGIESFSDKLCYFHWDEYPLESLPPNFNTEKLVVFHMERSLVNKLWDEVKDLQNLKIVNLSGCKQLIELPDFSKATNLHTILLRDCKNLCRFHPSILSLHKPAHLDLARCQALNSHHLAELHSLTSLTQISLSGCKQVKEKVLQILFDGLRCLESLNLDHCNELREIPDNISSLSLLTSLNIGGSSVEILPSSIKHLSKLQRLLLSNSKIKSLPELPLSIKTLYADCPLLKTIVSPFANSILEEPTDNREMDLMDFVFRRSGGLDEKSPCNIMVFTHLSMVRAIYSNSNDFFYMHSLRHVGGRVPEWFTYKGTSWVPFNISLASNCGEFLGFLLCEILPQFEGNCRLRFVFIYEAGEDGLRYDFSDGLHETFASYSYIYMWFLPCKGLERKYDEIVCYYEFEAYGKPVKGAECGVCPIYASQFDSLAAKILKSSDLDLSASNIPLTFHDNIDVHELQSAAKIAAATLLLQCNKNNPDHERVQPHFEIKINQNNNIFPPPLANLNERKGLQQLLP